MFEGYLADYNHNDGPILSIGEAQQLAKCWEGYQMSLGDAIVSIAKSSDAFAIDAIGASLSRNSLPRTYSHDNQHSQVGQWAGSPPQKFMKALPLIPSTDLSPGVPPHEALSADPAPSRGNMLLTRMLEIWMCETLYFSVRLLLLWCMNLFDAVLNLCYNVSVLYITTHNRNIQCQKGSVSLRRQLDP